MFPKSAKFFNKNIEFSQGVPQRNVPAANAPNHPQT